MNKTLLQAALIATALFSGYAAAQDVPDVLRGAVPAHLDRLLQPSGPVKVATCPGKFQAQFANGRLSCEKRIKQSDDIKCPSRFPNFVARNVTTGSDRDLCSRGGVVITSDGALTNVTQGSDYVFVPSSGVRDGVSYLKNHPSATVADGWRLDDSNRGASGITDRYVRTRVVPASPILVP